VGSPHLGPKSLEIAVAHFEADFYAHGAVGSGANPLKHNTILGSDLVPARRTHRAYNAVRRVLEGAVMIRLAVVLLSVLGPATGVAEQFPLPQNGGSVVGEVRSIITRHQDTLLDVARREGLGFEDIVRANPDINPWVPGEGSEVLLPTRYVLPAVPWEGVVINLPELRLYYFPKDGESLVETYPISIGRMDWGTPLGQARVISKVVDPSWYPPQSIRDEHAADNRPLPRIVPAGPDNPLGRHAMRLSIPGYLIHGTNKPAGVGMRVTHGCIRMFPEDIERLFKMIPLETPVRIINQPYKMGWGHDGELVMEAHLPLEEDRDNQRFGPTELTRLFVGATQERLVAVDWSRAEQIRAAALGIPEPISVV
jgi:L,D-transpeptidase ErfK/SrfK